MLSYLCHSPKGALRGQGAELQVFPQNHRAGHSHWALTFGHCSSQLLVSLEGYAGDLRSQL